MKRAGKPSAASTEQPQRHADGVLGGAKFLTGPQVADRFGVCRFTWWRWVKSRQAPAPRQLPGHPRWAVEDIERFERGRGR